MLMSMLMRITMKRNPNKDDIRLDSAVDAEDAAADDRSLICCGCWGCCCWWPLIDLLWMMGMLLMMTAHWFPQGADARMMMREESRQRTSFVWVLLWMMWMLGFWCLLRMMLWAELLLLMMLDSFFPSFRSPPWHSSLIHYRSDPYMYLNCIWLFLSIFKREHVLISFHLKWMMVTWPWS